MLYDYAIVGGGITGIALAEILSRKSGSSVLLIEKEGELGSKTTGGFHEWLHGFQGEPDHSFHQ